MKRMRSRQWNFSKRTTDRDSERIDDLAVYGDRLTLDPIFLEPDLHEMVDHRAHQETLDGTHSIEWRASSTSHDICHTVSDYSLVIMIVRAKNEWHFQLSKDIVEDLQVLDRLCGTVGSSAEDGIM